MVDEVHNPKDRDGVPLYGPMADYVNKATGDAMRGHQARLRDEGHFHPQFIKADVKAVRMAAIAAWYEREGNGK